MTDPVESPKLPIDDPSRVRGVCPNCGDRLVVNCYYVGGRGHVIVFECLSSLVTSPPTCDYRKVI